MGSGSAGPEGPPSVRVVIDYRERDSATARVLSQTEGVQAEYAELKTGDYLVGERVLFERKTIADFAQSVVDGRLFRQASRLAASSVPGVIVLEGGVGMLSSVGLRRQALQGALISLTLVFGVPVLRACDAEESARLMLYAAAQIKRVGHGWGGGAGYRPKGRRRQQLRLLQGLPGIGPKRAEQLLDAFGSVRGVVVAGPEEMAKIPGIGARTAERMEAVLREAGAVHSGKSRYSRYE